MADAPRSTTHRPCAAAAKIAVARGARAKAAAAGTFYARKVPRLGGLTVQARDRALCDPRALPYAVRVAPNRSTYKYICERINNVDAVRKFLNDPENADLLNDEKAVLVRQVRAREDARSWRSIERRIHQTLRGSPDQRYSIEKCMERVSLRVREYSFDDLVASEYLDEARPGAFWQIRLLVVLIMIIDDSGANILGHRNAADDKCAICLDSLTEEGLTNVQLEPCRQYPSGDSNPGLGPMLDANPGLSPPCAQLALYGVWQEGDVAVRYGDMRIVP